MNTLYKTTLDQHYNIIAHKYCIKQFAFSHFDFFKEDSIFRIPEDLLLGYFHD